MQVMVCGEEQRACRVMYRLKEKSIYKALDAAAELISIRTLSSSCSQVCFSLYGLQSVKLITESSKTAAGTSSLSSTFSNQSKKSFFFAIVQPWDCSERCDFLFPPITMLCKHGKWINSLSVPGSQPHLDPSWWSSISKYKP